MSDEVTISRAEYDRFVKESIWLDCLEQAGVDNWGGIEMAFEIKEDWEKELQENLPEK